MVSLNGIACRSSSLIHHLLCGFHITTVDGIEVDSILVDLLPGALALEDSRRNRLRLRIQFHIHSLGRFAIDNRLRIFYSINRTVFGYC